MEAARPFSTFGRRSELVHFMIPDRNTRLHPVYNVLQAKGGHLALT